MRSQKVKGKRQHARTYQQAGVDIHAAERLLARVAPMIRATHGPEVLRDLGQFAGLYHLANGARRDPVLVSSTDGAGTKITLAQQFGAHEAIGVYVVSATVALYFKVFVLVVQLFEKVPALKALAPTQSEPPFLATQLIVLTLFVVLAIVASIRFRVDPVEDFSLSNR